MIRNRTIGNCIIDNWVFPTVIIVWNKNVPHKVREVLLSGESATIAETFHENNSVN